MRRIPSLLAFALLAASLPATAQAALIPAPGKVEDGGSPVQQIGFHEYGNNAFIPDSVENILNSGLGRITNYFLLGLSGLAVLLLLWAGIQYITAGGNADKVKKARQTMINILLAIALIIGAYTLLTLIISSLQYLAQNV